MKRTDEEKICYEVNRLRGDHNAQNRFFGTAITIQNSDTTYDIEYAKRKMEFACKVLILTSFCVNHECKKCKLNYAHRNAVREISEGKRKRPAQRKEKLKVTTYIVNGRVTKVSTIRF